MIDDGYIALDFIKEAAGIKRYRIAWLKGLELEEIQARADVLIHPPKEGVNYAEREINLTVYSINHEDDICCGLLEVVYK